MLNVVQVTGCWHGCLRVLIPNLKGPDAWRAVVVVVVPQPESNGIGGGCMPLIYMRGEGKVHAFDAREEAPAAFSEDAFCKYPSCNESWRFWPERCTGGKGLSWRRYPSHPAV